MTKSARILVITGPGRGKTTSAMGLAVRASGHGISTAIIQFVKQSETGEAEVLNRIDNITFTQTGLGFIPEASSEEFEKHKAAAGEGLKLAAEAIASDQCNMVILDEVCVAVSKGLLSEAEVIDIVAKARPEQCIVLTGRGATKGIIDIADTVSEITCVKHGFESGIAAQKGVEF